MPVLPRDMPLTCVNDLSIFSIHDSDGGLLVVDLHVDVSLEHNVRETVAQIHSDMRICLIGLWLTGKAVPDNTTLLVAPGDRVVVGLPNDHGAEALGNGLLASDLDAGTNTLRSEFASVSTLVDVRILLSSTARHLLRLPLARYAPIRNCTTTPGLVLSDTNSRHLQGPEF
jgi:hypothetical protein